MRATIDLYLNHLVALLPQGTAWPRDLTSKLAGFLGSFAGGLTRAHNRALDLIEEADPQTTVELLTEWERVCGLPDDCTVSFVGTLQERRDAVVAKLRQRGGQSVAYFIGAAESLGYEITITEFRAYTCDSPIDTPVYDETWHHAWRVNAPETTIREFNSDSACTDPLASWGNDVLECVLSRLKPAHTHIIFSYGG